MNFFDDWMIGNPEETTDSNEQRNDDEEEDIDINNVNSFFEDKAVNVVDNVDFDCFG